MNIGIFPGAFKPFHDGHLSIIDNAFNQEGDFKLDKIIVIMSETPRENFSYSEIFKFMSSFLNEIYNKKIEVIHTNISPIKKCMEIISNDIANNYCLLRSNKDKDNEIITKYILTHYNNSFYFNSTTKAIDDKVISSTDIRKNIKENKTITKYFDKINKQSLNSIFYLKYLQTLKN